MSSFRQPEGSAAVASPPSSSDYRSVLPAVTPLELLPDEDRRLLVHFRHMLDTITGTMDVITAASEVFLSRGNYPVVHHLFGAWTEALAVQRDSEKVLFLLYVLNDALQKSASRRCPALLQLSRDPLRTFCLQVCRHHGGVLEACQRVFKILKHRRIFGSEDDDGDRICNAFLALLQGDAEVGVPNVSLDILRTAEIPGTISEGGARGSGGSQPHGLAAGPGGRGPISAPGGGPGHLTGNTVIDTFCLQYPSKADERVAELVAARFEEEPGETAFRDRLKEALQVIAASRSAIADKIHARRKLEQQLGQLQQEQEAFLEQQKRKRVKFAQCGILPQEDQGVTEEELTGSSNGEASDIEQTRLKNQIKAAQAKVKLLMELEWNKRVELQECLVTLARAIEVRMDEVLARHVRCREVKTVLDRALHMASRQQRQAQRMRDEKRASQAGNGGEQSVAFGACGKGNAGENGPTKSSTPSPAEEMPKDDKAVSSREGEPSCSGKTQAEITLGLPESSQQRAAVESVAAGETTDQILEGGGMHEVQGGLRENSSGGREERGNKGHNTESLDGSHEESQSSSVSAI
ncbi:hypothetical protein CSUI_003825 [Cystoisospora suis]|uniref:CID domain-containing protein n=1 Tax=Cystoisospora suis TaxID=483139 RepID=A0A2C6L434_9APIC|nr:hypothetical protein CSUI_003825 [Cystoisospora suis]